MKQTISQKRHRAKEHGFRARMKTSGGRRFWPPAALTGGRANGLTRAAATTPRLVMLSNPEDFAHCR